MKKALFFIAPVCLALAAIVAGNQTPEIAADYTPRQSNALADDAKGSQWYNHLIRANADGEIDERSVYLVREAVMEKAAEQQNQRSAIDLTWNELGPDNIGGRIRGVWADSDTEYWVGGVTGGLWHTTNAGNSWSHVADLPAQMIGAVARAGNGSLIVGTGSSFEGASGTIGSGSLGNGIWRSDDNGESWYVVPGTEPTPFQSGADYNECNALAPDPNNENGIWMGGNFGLIYYNLSSGDLQGGWDVGNGNVQDIELSPNGDLMLVAALAGSTPRVHRSTDNGQTFTIESGTGDSDLPQSQRNRARVAISDTDPNKCFVLYSASNSTMGGLYYSSDGGANWQSVWPETEEVQFDPMVSLSGQGFYDLALGIDPNDPTLAYVGGVTLWKAGPNQQPEQIALNFIFPSSPLYVHSDIHEITYTPGGRMLIGCDGGMHRSDDGASFTQINRDLNITQFYSIAHSSGDAVLGGTQDNGSLVIFGDDTFLSDQEALEVTGGDGFDCALSQVTVGSRQLAFTTIYNGQLFRYDDNAAGGTFYDDELTALIDPVTGFLGNDFFTSIRSFEDTEDDEAEQYIILINPADSTIVDPSESPDTNAFVQASTLNLDLPFFHEFEDGKDFMFWDSIVRDGFELTDGPYEAPTTAEILEAQENGEELFWWLEPQPLLEIIEDCMTDSLFAQLDSTLIETEILDSVFVEEAEIWVTYVADIDTTYEVFDVYDYFETCDSTWVYGPTVDYEVRENWLIQDRYSTLFALGLGGSNGLWITRQAFNLNVTPDWFKVVDNTGSGVNAMEFDPTGDVLYYSNYGSNLFRLTGLDQLWQAEDVANTDLASVLSAGGLITGIAVDPNDPNHVVCTVGGYGINSGGKVRETFNALDASPTWNNIWLPNSDDLARMPVYDVEIDVIDETGATIFVGTEYGVFTTDDGGSTWVMANDPDPADPNNSTGIGLTPVYDLHQQHIESARFRNPTNFGAVWAGTHGRGIFRSNTNLSTDVDETAGVTEAEQPLLVYPNPNSGVFSVDLNLDAVTDAEFEVYSIDGKLMKTITRQQVSAGTQTIRFDFRDLPNGNYILRTVAGDLEAVSRFVTMR